MTGANLLQIFITNGMGLLLMYGILVGNTFHIRKSLETRMIRAMAMILLVCCIIDPIVFSLDGKAGPVVFYILYIGNFLLYLANLLFCPLFLILVERQTLGKNSKLLKRIIVVVDLAFFFVLCVNFFKPIIFYVDDANCYQRLPMFFLYTALGMFYAFLAVVIYIISRIKGGVFKTFPVIELVVPTFLALIIQGSFYGISLIWPGTAVGLTLMVLSFQNRNLLLDMMTGLYNRNYLDSFKHGHKKFCMMMLDLNGFKSINDTFGHTEGDAALIKTAELILTSIGAMGTAVRYAGDEFIVLLNTDNELVVREYIERMEQTFDAYYNGTDKPYQITFSLGWGIFDFSNNTMDTVLKILDQRMYDSKRAYYCTHERRKCE